MRKIPKPFDILLEMWRILSVSNLIFLFVLKCVSTVLYRGFATPHTALNTSMNFAPDSRVCGVSLTL